MIVVYKGATAIQFSGFKRFIPNKSRNSVTVFLCSNVLDAWEILDNYGFASLEKYYKLMYGSYMNLRVVSKSQCGNFVIAKLCNG